MCGLECSADTIQEKGIRDWIYESRFKCSLIEAQLIDMDELEIIQATNNLKLVWSIWRTSQFLLLI